MKFILDLLVAFLPGLFTPVVDAIKLELLKVYVQGVDKVRRVFVYGVLALFSVLFLLTGLVLIHIAAFFLMPWSPQTNAFILLGLGLFYFIVPTIFVFRLCSQRTWMKLSGAESIAGKILNK